MTKSNTQTSVAPIAPAAVAAVALKLVKITCAGLFRFNTYKPESKQYGKVAGHYVFGAGGAWLDLPLNAPYVHGGDASMCIVTEAKAASIAAYAKAKGYEAPKAEPVSQ